jgi:SAM-dependent methyltransferase
MHHLGIRPPSRVLDFGCAKGYVVKSLRLLGIDAYGCDISHYAVGAAPEDTRPYLKVIQNSSEIAEKYDWILAKDVLEHISYEELPEVLANFRARCDNLFVLVPLGMGTEKRYVVPAFELDRTHIIREPLEWWHDVLDRAGFKNISMTYQMPHMKENYDGFAKGNGFLVGR